MDPTERVAELLLANFYTIRFPRHGAEWRWPALLSERAERGIRADRLICTAHRNRIRLTLWQAGHIRFLDMTEGAMVGDWRLHFFLTDAETLPLIDPAEGVLSEGTPIALNPAVFVRRRLQVLVRTNRLSGGYPWCDDDFPPISPDRLAGIVL